MRIGLRGREADNGANGRTNEAQTRFSDAAAFCRHFSVSETAFHPNGRSGFGKNATQRVLRPLRVIFSCFRRIFAKLRLRYPQTAANG